MSDPFKAYRLQLAQEERSEALAARLAGLIILAPTRQPTAARCKYSRTKGDTRMTNPNATRKATIRRYGVSSIPGCNGVEASVSNEAGHTIYISPRTHKALQLAQAWCKANGYEVSKVI